MSLQHRPHVLHYPDVRSLTHELKALGAHNLNPGRPGGLTGRARMLGLVEAYEQFRQAQGLPATYQVVYAVLEKPVMSAAYFITGTDTDVGKTTIAAGLLHAARLAGLSTAAGKPVASGCDVTPKGLRNADALALMAECSMPLTYRTGQSGGLRAGDRTASGGA